MSKSLFIICCIMLQLISLFIGYFGQAVAFSIVGFLFSFGGLFLLKKNPFQNKKIGYILIFGLYPSLIFGMFIFYFNDPAYGGHPQTLILFISILCAFIVHKKSNPQLIKIGAVYLLFLGVLTTLLPNYYNWRLQNKYKYEILEKDLPELKTFDENGKPLDLKKADGKIIVLDIWNSSCGICIKKFPDFEKLKNEFSKDSSIVFYTLNLPMKRFIEKKKEVEKYTNPYSFGKLYADDNVQKQLNINSVPQYMIIDKNKKVRYLGSLNTGTLEFYNNFYSIIEKIK